MDEQTKCHNSRTPAWFFIVAVAIATGCGPPKVQHDAPVIVGQRTNSEGQVVAQIVRDTGYTTKTALLTPEGPRKSVKYDIKYFLQERGMPSRELSVLNHGECSVCARFWPVDNTNLWVGAGINPVSNENTGHVAVIDGRRIISHNENDLHVVVFDERRIISQRVFSVVPKSESSEEEFRFDSRNGAVLFRSPGGLKRYDVLTGAVVSMEENAQRGKSDGAKP